MPTERLATGVRLAWWRRAWPECVVGVVAAIIFLGCLGSVDLWGKREQRASAEVLDTIAHQHWLVADIQGRPRLEKPPLPRWIIAGLMEITGRRDEWIVRLPNAGFALATVVLVYLLGCRMSGRSVGLASAMILATSGLFVGEMRQAGNDGPLTFFTALALFAAWRVLEGDADDASRRWRRLFYLALGLGFLCKGPIVLMLTIAAIVPYLVQTRRLSAGLSRLMDGPGWLLFAMLAASWPILVAWHDPEAVSVWLTEMSEKTGLLRTLNHRHHGWLIGRWPQIMFPWSIVAMTALIMPMLRRDRASTSIWFAWWWSVGCMAIFSMWEVAKSYYYLPCTPGLALLSGEAWVRLSRRARGAMPGRAGASARLILQAQCVLLFVGGVVFPIVTRPLVAPDVWPWTIAASMAMAAGVVVGVWAWRRGSNAMAIAPMVAALAFGVVIVYGVVAPSEDRLRSHRALAETLPRLIPPDVETIHFYNELDEGLWFYLRGVGLAPVPGTQPRYSTSYDLVAAYKERRDPSESIEHLDLLREDAEKRALLRWIDRAEGRAYLLIRSDFYDRYGPELAARVTPVYREAGLGRNELLLARKVARPTIASSTTPVRR